MAQQSGAPYELIAQIACHTGCFVRGIRIVRLPDGGTWRAKMGLSSWF
jgi:hypothetical protein